MPKSDTRPYVGKYQKFLAPLTGRCAKLPACLQIELDLGKFDGLVNEIQDTRRILDEETVWDGAVWHHGIYLFMDEYRSYILILFPLTTTGRPISVFVKGEAPAAIFDTVVKVAINQIGAQVNYQIFDNKVPA